MFILNYFNHVDLYFRLYRNLTLVVDDPEEAYPNINVVWQKFVGLFTKLAGFLFNTDAFKDFYIECMDEFNRDNVQYLEFRALLTPV